mmetsp:Transcript_5597/g.14627  ORF Transcript_5597/g.14627 Transcript_5597/m.14627 type:complete len:134 (-) Transcript_5597:171-572(-)
MPPKGKDKGADEATAGVTWFYVKHGAAQKSLFNADCWAFTLLDQVKETAAQAPDAVCDLQDGETGALLGLPEVDPRASASALVKAAGVYILVRPLYAADGPPAVTGMETLYTPPEGEALPPAPKLDDGKKKGK